MTAHPITTYMVTDARAVARQTPEGVVRAHLILNQLFQGRKATHPGWIERMDDAGLSSRGFVRTGYCETLDLPSGVATLPVLAWTDARQDAKILRLERRARDDRKRLTLLGEEVAALANEVVRLTKGARPCRSPKSN